MGVPKFFRYISERYPCLSEFVKEYQIPDFDNLYLDMNGIIHNCSHPDDGNALFRITEEKIFADIFHYIETLFQMIKPQKVFFMAVDGVAPRAKMNQQRGRRFRSAMDAQKLENEAVKKGEKLPDTPRFDSNCITPGTEFMTRLHNQLKYFVVKKVSEDPLWQRCEVILSGHETPGEGEHKIMDYIRYRRSQPGYDPNTRHCLYGLDADLIMLGLCTHDPHFSLLREEVKFGRKSTKKTSVPEEIRFYLLHLSLMREYLEMEFSSLKGSLKNFKFDIEKIIDDWVLMGFLVGNDFIPNLPNLHIANGALAVLYKAYSNILPQLDGYINESGILNLKRFEIFMKELGGIDSENFEEIKEDLLYMEMKTGRKTQPFMKNNTKLKDQQFWKPEEESLKPEYFNSLDPKHAVIDSGLSALIASTEIDYLDDEDDEDPQSEDDDDEDVDFRDYKKSYYKQKLEYKEVTPDVMRSQAEGYVRAIQWNLHYYYNGVCSWSWYYPHHYAPFISDVKNFQNLKLEYDMGRPFMPYEQLLAVLPSASKQFLPECYQSLMTDDNSPIKQYYPENFDTDLNGKKQDWEAVVLIPFIDEKLLLEAMKSCESELTSREALRNRHGPMLSYKFTEENLGIYESPMYFPNIQISHAKVRPISLEELRVPVSKLVKGAYPGVLMDVYYPGFPTFKHLEYQGHLKKAKVKVFDQSSRGENMIIQVIPSERVLDAKIPVELLNKIVYVGWPHLVEARVVSLHSSKEQFVYKEGKDPLAQSSSDAFKSEVEAVTDYHNNRMGIEFGKVIVLVKAQKMIGRKYMVTSTGKVSLEEIFCKNTSNFPLQLIVEDVNMHTESHKVYQTLRDAFPVDSSCFVLTKDEFYGAKGTIKNDDKTPEGKVCVSVTICDEPDLSNARHKHQSAGSTYSTSYEAARQLGMSSFLFSRITGSFFVTAKNKEGGLKTINLGLNLKLNKKNLETTGFTKKIGSTWLYSDAAVDAVAAYADEFPEVFDYMVNSDNRNEDTSIEDVFPEDSDEKGKAVLTWLKSQPHSHAERKECNSLILDKQVIEEIEKLINGYKAENSKSVVIYCMPNAIFKPDLCFGNLLPDPDVEVQLFDRIINVRANHTVPLGLKGTIIGINRSSSEATTHHMYDVLFDSTFEGGIEINCTPGRGYRLPLNAFIDVSHGKRLLNGNVEQSDSTVSQHDQMRKENNYRKQQNHNYQNNTNSAFAKFDNRQIATAHAYHAVPPYMPNGEPIYKPHNAHAHSQNYSHGRSAQVLPENWRYEEKKLEPFNPFPKKYDPNFDLGFNRNVQKNSNRDEEVAKIRHVDQKVQNRNERNDFRTSYQSKSNIGGQKTLDFMPAFKKMDLNTNTSDQSKPIEETADALKKILKIGSSDDKESHIKVVTFPPKNRPNAPSIPSNKQTDQYSILQRNQQNIKIPEAPLAYQIEPKRHITAQAPPFRVQPNIPFSVQLLSYYQSNGLGLPRYQYVTTENGVQSQIKLPNRQILIGPPARSREEASELVAEQALSQINPAGANSQNDGTKQLKDSPKKIPEPPMQWRQKAKTSPQPQMKQINKHQSNIEAANNAWRGLVPLQVVKKEKANSSSYSDVAGSEKSNKNPRTVSNTAPDHAVKEVPQVSQKKEEKPRRQRKMRIAANFGMQP